MKISQKIDNFLGTGQWKKSDFIIGIIVCLMFFCFTYRDGIDFKQMNFFNTKLNKETISNQKIIIEYVEADKQPKSVSINKIFIYINNKQYLVSPCVGLEQFICKKENNNINLEIDEKYQVEFLVEDVREFRKGIKNGLLYRIDKLDEFGIRTNIFTNKNISKYKKFIFGTKILAVLPFTIFSFLIIFFIFKFFTINKK